MHEVTLCKSLLAVVLEKIPPSATRHKISRIYLDVGQLLSVDIHALRFAFQVVAQQTLAEQASLEIQEIQGQGHCSTCQCVADFPCYYTACPSCGNFTLEVLQGEELRVRSMEMETL